MSVDSSLEGSDRRLQELGYRQEMVCGDCCGACMHHRITM